MLQNSQLSNAYSGNKRYAPIAGDRRYMLHMDIWKKNLTDPKKSTRLEPTPYIIAQQRNSFPACTLTSFGQKIFQRGQSTSKIQWITVFFSFLGNINNMSRCRKYFTWSATDRNTSRVDKGWEGVQPAHLSGKRAGHGLRCSAVSFSQKTRKRNQSVVFCPGPCWH